MKKLIAILFVFISVLAVFSGNSAHKESTKYSSSEIVIDSLSNRILYEKNAREKRYPASTTKILTAICIIENCDLNEIITVKKETVGVEGSSIYLEEGERISIEELLYGLMLRSGNDCAETLAVHCSGSIENFARLMNDTAKRIGANDSHFINPHGLHNDEHYTTAYDLAIISSYAIKNAEFLKIVSTKAIDISHSTRNYKRHLINKNKMLSEFEGANGIKTGYTKKAGRCLVSSCKRNGMQLISVVLNCGPMWEVSKSILNNCFNEYVYEFLVDSKNIIDFLEIEGYGKLCPVYIKKDLILPLTNEEKSNIKIEYEYNEKINFPVKNNTEIGLIKIYAENNLIFTEKIYTIIDILGEVYENK